MWTDTPSTCVHVWAKRVGVFYYEQQITREVKRIHIRVYRTYVRVSVLWKTKLYNGGNDTSRIHYVEWGTGIPKDKDEVKRREVWECDGWVCDLETTDTSSMFRVIRRAAVLVNTRSAFAFSCEKNTTLLKWKWPRLDCAWWTPEVIPSFLFIMNQ